MIGTLLDPTLSLLDSQGLLKDQDAFFGQIVCETPLKGQKKIGQNGPHSSPVKLQSVKLIPFHEYQVRVEIVFSL